MRRAFNASFVYQNDQFAGIDLGSFNHTCGCGEIQEALGVDETKERLEGFCSTKSPRIGQCTLSIVKFRDGGMEWSGLYFDGRHPYERAMNTKDRVPKPIIYEEDEICSAWNENEFGIVVNKKYSWMIDDLLMAIIHNDLIVKIDDSNSIKGDCLNLLIRSRVLCEVKR